MQFVKSITAKITAKTIDLPAKQITFAGITANDSVTPEIAQEQINKLFAIVGNEVIADGMKRTTTEEAANNG